MLNQGQMEKTNNDSNTRWMYVLNKAQRIAFAIYRVTDHLPIKEPIKWKLRDMSFVLIEYTRKMVRGNIKDVYLKDSRDVMTEMIVLLDIGLVTDNYSRMNFELLKKELLLLCERLDNLSSDVEVADIVELQNLLRVSDTSDSYEISARRDMALPNAIRPMIRREKMGHITTRV